MVTTAIVWEHIKDEKQLRPQKVKRRSIQFDGKWYASQELLAQHGEEVDVIPMGHFLVVRDHNGVFWIPLESTIQYKRKSAFCRNRPLGGLQGMASLH